MLRVTLRPGLYGLMRATAVLVVALSLQPTQRANAGTSTGQQIAHDVYKGNCLGCHQIPRDPKAVSLANIGPPLENMRERFADRALLRSQIWDATARNPQTVMPPFGKHKILTEAEIDLVIDYLYQY